MNDLDEWLNSIGLNDATAPISTSPQPINSTEIAQEPVQSSPQEFSESDISEILADNGFIPMADAEEIQEEPEEITEPQAAENEVHFHMPNGEVIDVPVVEEQIEVTQEPVEEPEPLLPPNSPTLLIDESTSRFSGTEWYDAIQRQKIILAGCGGIGSNLALQLARLHPYSITLFDGDRVERANMSGQFYSMNDSGRYKTEALYNHLSMFTNCARINSIPRRFTENSPSGPVMMCGFDSMEARRVYFDKWARYVDSADNKSECLFLDGRLSIDTLQVLCITGDDTYNMARYQREFLFSDSEAEETICSMKQTTYMACMIGSIMTNLFVNFIANQLSPVIPYDLPFFTEYDSQNMIFKTEN